MYGLTFLKFRAYPYHLSVQLLLDVGNTLCCLPTYVVWAKNELQSYLVKDQSLSLSITNKDLPPEELMDEISRQREQKREAHEQQFFRDMDQYVPKELQQGGVACLGLSYVLMAYFRFKKF